ncbi:glycosyltransferase [Carboxylicivirga sp. RSCT41]|uniref:glycosyltransferase n=1 Tax=Carboxylicivirga agarovorans TaxID=3417570 RepID=UPI003D33D978
MKLIHVFPLFRRFGGAQKVIMSLYNSFSYEYDSYISSFQSYEEIHEIFREKVKKENYITFSFSGLKELKGGIIVSHDRKMTLLLMLLKPILPFQLIHIAHGVYYNKKLFSLFPKNIIAVSYAVKRNLTEVFNVKSKNISVIHNGLMDCGSDVLNINYPKNEKVKILFLGQIENNKQQLELVKLLKDNINKDIQIDFAGEGEGAQDLKAFIDENNLGENFNYIGFQSHVDKLILDYQYVMLFSKKEGLGISLIEACMMGRPVLAKTIGGSEACGEICIDGYNGFNINSNGEVIHVINNLSNINENKYQELCYNARKLYNEKFNKKLMMSRYSAYFDAFKSFHK